MPFLKVSYLFQTIILGIHVSFRECSYSKEMFWFLNQWLFLVPVKGGIGGIVHPPIGRKNATYILPSGGLYTTDTTF